MFHKKLTSLLLCLALILSACATHKSSSDERNELYTLPGLDHGLLQSPINILSFKEKTTGHLEITVHFQDEIAAIQNLGHTVQLDFSEGSDISYNGLTYNFNQIHFHTPSEHLIDGVTYPMELHVVTSIPTKDKSDVPRYLVLAFLFKMGKANPFINEFINLIPRAGDATTSLTPGTVKLRGLFSGTEQRDPENFFHYRGSLTTPPHTETVQWFVFKHIIEASPEQIEALNLIEGDNTRHIQGTFDREVN